MSKMPWEYTEPVKPDSLTAKRNLPTPEGRELGYHLARFCDQAEAKLKAEGFVDVPTRCADCAFRAGTNPNGSPTTGMDALKCWMEREPFYCHAGIDIVAGEDPKRLCAGWVIMVGDSVVAEEAGKAGGK